MKIIFLKRWFSLIAGIGTDIVEIGRIEKAIRKNVKFMDKVFSKEEKQYLESRNMRPEYVAGRFAAKEAVSKALVQGLLALGLRTSRL